MKPICRFVRTSATKITPSAASRPRRGSSPLSPPTTMASDALAAISGSWGERIRCCQIGNASGDLLTRHHRVTAVRVGVGEAVAPDDDDAGGYHSTLLEDFAEGVESLEAAHSDPGHRERRRVVERCG